MHAVVARSGGQTRRGAYPSSLNAECEDAIRELLRDRCSRGNPICEASVPVQVAVYQGGLAFARPIERLERYPLMFAASAEPMPEEYGEVRAGTRHLAQVPLWTGEHGSWPAELLVERSDHP